MIVVFLSRWMSLWLLVVLPLDGLVLRMSTEVRPRLPVTVLSGFLGAGKTTMLRHILQTDHAGKRYAVIVNDMSELNIDGDLVKAHVQHEKEQLVEMSNGCICCTLREDLLKEVAQLARAGRFDHLIIESTGVSEPLPVAETFLFETDNSDPSAPKESLMDLAEIDSMVTVVDAVSFVRDLVNAEDLSTRGQAVDENDARTITDLLVSQVEFASVVVINKCDLVTSEELLRVKQAVSALNAEAKILCTTRSKIDISEVVGSRSYDFDRVSQSATWLKAINADGSGRQSHGHGHGHGKSESEEYGISSFVYRARRPFHPTRLMDFVNSRLASITGDENDDEEEENANNERGDVVVNDKVKARVTGESTEKSSPRTAEVSAPRIFRSKGFFWLASRPSECMVWSQAGGLFSITPGGPWWADTPRPEWPTDETERADIERDWVDIDVFGGSVASSGPVGDRRQEIVFIGTDMAPTTTTIQLDECLLTESELLAGEEMWVELDDPFPPSPPMEQEYDVDGTEGEVTMVLPPRK